MNLPAVDAVGDGAKAARDKGAEPIHAANPTKEESMNEKELTARVVMLERIVVKLLRLTSDVLEPDAIGEMFNDILKDGDDEGVRFVHRDLEGRLSGTIEPDRRRAPKHISDVMAERTRREEERRRIFGYDEE